MVTKTLASSHIQSHEQGMGCRFVPQVRLTFRTVTRHCQPQVQACRRRRGICLHSSEGELEGYLYNDSEVMPV